MWRSIHNWEHTTMRSSAWLATSLRLVAGSAIFPPPVFSNVPPPPAHRRSISWRASLSGVRHSIPTICTCNQTPTVSQKNAELERYPWLRWRRVFQIKSLCIVHLCVHCSAKAAHLLHSQEWASVTDQMIAWPGPTDPIGLWWSGSKGSNNLPA
jgi:hypothetical protein